MVIEVDLSTVPPGLLLVEPDDIGSFSVRVIPADHAYVDPETLTALAGERASDETWVSGMAAMVRYASEHGWVREADGAIRAHIER